MPSCHDPGGSKVRGDASGYIRNAVGQPITAVCIIESKPMHGQRTDRAQVSRLIIAWFLSSAACSVVIYQRTDTMTAVWQCRIAFPGQPYIRHSLKTRNENKTRSLQPFWTVFWRCLSIRSRWLDAMNHGETDQRVNGGHATAGDVSQFAF